MNPIVLVNCTPAPDTNPQEPKTLSGATIVPIRPILTLLETQSPPDTKNPQYVKKIVNAIPKYLFKTERIIICNNIFYM